MVAKAEIDRYPYDGIGDVVSLANDMERVRQTMLKNLQRRRANAIAEAEAVIALENRHIVALGGYADYPDFTREEDGS